MLFTPLLQPPANMLAALYSQHVSYSAELAQTHQALSKLYKKLAKVERVLAEREERQLTRSEKRKWQYARALSKRSVLNLESQQAALHDKLHQCNNLIASFEQGAYNSPVTPWTAGLPPSPFMFTPFSPFAYSPWSMTPHRPSLSVQSTETQPQYWDLSMLRERRLSSPQGSSADSGFHEPLTHTLGPRDEPLYDPTHVYAHEIMSPLAPVLHSQFAGSDGVEEEGEPSNAVEERDEVPALEIPVSPAAAKVGAEGTNTHKRCYSVDAASPVIQSHLAAPAPTTTKRANSVGSRQIIEEESRETETDPID